LELLFVSPDEDMEKIKNGTGSDLMNEIGLSTSGSDHVVNGTEPEVSSSTVEVQTESRKHVTFEDSISLTDSNLDPPNDDPADPNPDQSGGSIINDS